MKNKNMFNLFGFIIISTLFFLTGCVKQSSYSKNEHTEHFTLKPFEKTLLAEEKTLEQLSKEEQKIKVQKKELQKTQPEEILRTKKIDINENQGQQNNQAELDFYVQNTTGKPIYAVCFSYIQKHHIQRWRWDKSNVYKIKNNETIKIDIDYIKDEKNRANIYGYLAIFDNRQNAEDSIYELLQDKKKIALDQLYKLKNQIVVIGVEKYGLKGELLDHIIVPIEGTEEKFPELDFVIENKTGKTLLVTCFVYQRKEDAHVWRFDKTPIIKLKPNEYGLIDVDTIGEKYERVYLRGYLAVFEEDRAKEAEESTFELLSSEKKISIGRIADLKNKKVILEVEQYGIIGSKIDFTIHPIRRIDFEKALNLKNY